MYKILVINPGSTSTKIGCFEDGRKKNSRTIRHSKEELEPFKKIIDELDFRKKEILKWIDREGIELDEFDAVVGRGGLLRPIEGGTYRVNQKMLEDLKNGRQGEHASNLGGILASSLSDDSVPAFIVDPVVVDEMDPIAKITGRPEIMRRSIFHALNQKATARKIAGEMGKKYEEVNLIVAHLGGGISVGAHKRGKVVDVNNALNGDGPFGPERAGGLPVWDSVNHFIRQNYNEIELRKKLAGDAGVAAHLGTNDMFEVVDRIESGDRKAEEVFKAMVYQTSKEIGKLAPVFAGDIDGIVLTGGLSREKLFTDEVKRRTEFIAPIYISPGEGEMKALAEGALRVLKGEEEIKEY